MKKLISMLLVVSCLSSLSFAVTRTKLADDPAGPRALQAQVVRNAKELTSGASTYALAVASVTVIAANVNREKIRIVNPSTLNFIYCMESSSLGSNPTAAGLRANGFKIAVSTVTTIATGILSNTADLCGNVLTESMYNGKIYLIQEDNVSASISVIVTEFFKQ